MSRLPEWTLVGFAAWTLLLLLATVGVYRFGHIFRGLAGMVRIFVFIDVPFRWVPARR